MVSKSSSKGPETNIDNSVDNRVTTDTDNLQSAASEQSTAIGAGADVTTEAVGVAKIADLNNSQVSIESVDRELAQEVLGFSERLTKEANRDANVSEQRFVDNTTDLAKEFSKRNENSFDKNFGILSAAGAALGIFYIINR